MIEYVFGIRVVTPEANGTESPIVAGTRNNAVRTAGRQHHECYNVRNDSIIYLPDRSDTKGNLFR